MSWQAVATEVDGRRYVHTYPLEDSIGHIVEDSAVSSCPCGPVTTQVLDRDYCWHHVHSSLDGRELTE